MTQLTIRADEVVVGDQIFNSLSSHQAYSWTRVTKIETCGQYVVLSAGYDTWKYPAEAIAVRREEPCG